MAISPTLNRRLRPKSRALPRPRRFRVHIEELEPRHVFSASIAGQVFLATHTDPGTPNDPKFGQLYGLQKISAEQAWDISTGSTKVVVADIDTGIDYTHPDLYKNVWINQYEIPASRRVNLTDVDGDGLITFWDLND